LRGVLGVVDEADGSAAGQEALARALLAGGAAALQLRMKQAPAGAVLEAARRLRAIAAEAGAALFVNDRLDVALAAGADGVHLGQLDLSLADARAVVGARPEFWIGVSTHDAAQVRAAVAGGADYLGYGPVYATATKRDPDPVQGTAALAAAVALAAPVPVVAIGGIGPDDVEAVVATGAAAVCAIGAVNRAEDPAAVVRRMVRAFG
jgi:thiamine-phosphate pyrophosphorylase